MAVGLLHKYIVIIIKVFIKCKILSLETILSAARCARAQRERERERETETETQREKQRQRQTDRQRQADRQTDRDRQRLEAEEDSRTGRKKWLVYCFGKEMS